ncbi:hypothetical protein KCU77_g9313, partial [Aureobasidium melanogenum]
MFGEKTTTSKSTSSSPTSTPSKPSPPQTMTPRHAELEFSYPAAFFGKKPTKSTMVSEKERRDSVSSTATTATSSSVTSSATTIAPSQTAVPEKPFDVFEYQTAGYLSMPMTHESQPYLQGQPSSERKSSASSSSSAGSLWSKAKNKIHRKSPSVEEQEKKEQEKQERKKEYEALGLEEKVKFGTKGGMSMVG